MPEPWLGDVLGSWALGSDGTVLAWNAMPVLGVTTTVQPSRESLDAASAPNG